MRISKFLQLTLVTMAGLAMAGSAEARRSRRDGFNFGTSVRLLEGEAKTTPGIGSDQTTQVTSDSQAVTPYLGYAFGSINLGLAFAAETSATQSIERDESGVQTTRKSERRTMGGNLFFRFLFGDLFFFEGAGGLYQEQLGVTTETKTAADEDGTFTGASDSYEVNGIGPGYHVGAGLELPMGGSFFFTSTYQFRMVTLRDYPGGVTLGKKRSVSQKREALFGIAYYHH